MIFILIQRPLSSELILNADDCIVFYSHQRFYKTLSIKTLELDKRIKISTKTAYRLVLQGKAVGGALYKYLRHQYKKCRKRYGKNDYQGRIPNHIDINDTPALLIGVLVLATGRLDLAI